MVRRGIFVFVLPLLLLASITLPIGQSPLSGMNISTAINYTEGTINKVNGSSYLVFQPNLAQANQYLASAKNLSQTDAPGAYSYLDMAISSANAQQVAISRFKDISFAVLLGLAVITALFLYLFSKPVGKRKHN